MPRSVFAEARRVTIPLHVLLRWDDEGNDRQLGAGLFDDFGSNEKTLRGQSRWAHRRPRVEADASARFFARHLR